MAKKASNSYMTKTERIAGTVLFLVYLLVMPLLLSRLFDLAELLLGTRIGAVLRGRLYAWVLFAAAVLLFHSFLARTTSRFFDDLNQAFSTLGLGLIVFYGANELAFRFFALLLRGRANLNDAPIAAGPGGVTALAVVLLLPFVEEVFFRGLVFGCLRERSRAVAYALSALLFAFFQVWAFSAAPWQLSRIPMLLLYLVPGLVFAWVYDRSDTLWTAILLHAGVNALALWALPT